MTERLSHRPKYLRRTAPRSGPTPPLTHGRDGDLPPPPPAYLADDNAAGDGEETILGFPAETDEDDEDDEPPVEEIFPVDLVVIRHPDRVACVLLILAGVAANVSLSLAWLAASSTIGLTLVSRGIDVLGDGVGALLGTGLWQPVTVVLGGGLLILLGVVLLVPTRAHRLVGVLALLVSLVTAAAILVLFAEADWRVERFGVGTWFAVAVPVLGILGSLKAMLTVPDVTIARRDRQASV
jgi:hypothetical protein